MNSNAAGSTRVARRSSVAVSAIVTTGHSSSSPVKPIRLWMEVGDRDLLNPNVMRDNLHDWVVANENMARALAAKGYHYQFVFVRNAGHTDRTVKQQTLPQALEWLWKGYSGDGAK